MKVGRRTSERKRAAGILTGGAEETRMLTNLPKFLLKRQNYSEPTPQYPNPTSLRTLGPLCSRSEAILHLQERAVPHPVWYYA